eukprot:357127_1
MTSKQSQMSQRITQNMTVFGFCNRLEPKIRIPADIMKLCLDYYALPDEWDTKSKSKEIHIHHHGKYKNILARYPWQQLKTKRQRVGTAFGLKVCTTGVHQWILRIIESQNDHANYSIVVGVIKTQFMDECITEDSSFKHPGGTNAQHRLPVAFMRFNRKDRGYGFVGNKARKIAKFNISDHKIWRYGAPFKEVNDMMRVILDLDNYTLSYVINDKHYGTAFDVDENC